MPLHKGLGQLYAKLFFYRFGNKIIGETYEAGQLVDIEIDIVANHWGFFEMKLCRLTNDSQQETQECFDEHPLEVESFPNFSNMIFSGQVMKTPSQRLEAARAVVNITCEAILGARDISGNARERKQLKLSRNKKL